MSNAGTTRLLCAFAGAAMVLTVGILPVAGEQANSREQVTVTESDVTAVKDAGPGLVHGLASHKTGAKEKLRAVERERSKNASAFRDALPRTEASSQASIQTPTGPHFYPGDLTSGGGPTLSTTRMHAVYVNATKISGP